MIICHITNDYKSEKFCHNLQWFGLNQYWVGTWNFEFHHYRELSKQRMAEKLCCLWGSNPQPCASLIWFSAKRLLRLAFFRLDLSALVKWLFSRITLRWSLFFIAGCGTQPLKGIFHPNNSAPLLGLQHVATMPANSTILCLRPVLKIQTLSEICSTKWQQPSTSWVIRLQELEQRRNQK